MAVALAAADKLGTNEVMPPLEEDQDLASVLSGDTAAPETRPEGDAQ